MSCVGFDVGNENCVVAIARARGIDVVLNDESNRETPAMVSFGEKQRALGTAAAAVATMNPKNTISQIKRLIGKKYSDPEVQADMALFPFKVIQGPDDEPLVQVMYLNESRTFSTRQILAALLSNLKTIAEQNLGTSVSDCVIGIPSYFIESQRRAYVDAARICGLNPLRLMHETTATALAYGIYKTDLPEKDPIYVAFVDVGHSSLQVCITAFKKGELRMLAHAYDRNLGGRDLDEVIYDHFVEKFKTEYKIDVRTSDRASMRLRAGCERLKKVLSANPQAPPMSIECLMDEKDVRGVLNREEFEELAATILDRVLAPCQRALQISGLTVEQISAVELVGSGSRVPAICKTISTFFKQEPKRTMNASECIARGCALQCAMLSPTFKVREFEVNDSYVFPIALVSKGAAAEVEGEEAATPSNTIIFTENNPLPSTKIVTYHRSEPFSIDAVYSDPSMLPPGVSPKLGTYMIGPLTPSKPEEKFKQKVKFRLNLHGIVSVDSATQFIEEEGEVSVPATGSAGKETTDETANGATDFKMEDADAQTAGASDDANGAQAAEEKVDKMDTDAPKAEALKKKKVKKVDIPVSSVALGAISETDVEALKEAEFEMALQDRVMEETKDKKNAVEAYVYEMRNKLCDKLQDYVTPQEKEDMSARLQETEDWLYEDGADESKGVYISKLEELKKLGNPLESRQREDEGRADAIRSLTYCINSFREAALSADPKYAHIDPAEKQKVVEECEKAAKWLQEKEQQQKELPKASNPVLLTYDITKKAETLDRFCKPIMMKAKPPPPKPASSTDTKEEKGGAAPQDDTATSGEPMEADATPKEDTMED